MKNIPATTKSEDPIEVTISTIQYYPQYVNLYNHWTQKMSDS